MPGYNGYIPRIYTTEMGLGCRYNNMTRNGLHMFKAEQDAHFDTMSQPINVKAYVFSSLDSNFTLVTGCLLLLINTIELY